MALLDYKCDVCGEKFSELVSFKEVDKVRCPKCGSKNVKQIFEGTSSFGIGAKAVSPKGRSGG